jgi:carbon-monoxide dehydrogenase large subunit
MVFPGELHVKFVRSPHAHARILSIDISAAQAMPGVVAIVTGSAIAEWTQPLRMAPPVEGLHPVTVEAFPTEKVRFDGDLVACVVAETPIQAEDASERVLVDYESLVPVMSAADGLSASAPMVDDALSTNLISH